MERTAVLAALRQVGLAVAQHGQPRIRGLAPDGAERTLAHVPARVVPGELIVMDVAGGIHRGDVASGSVAAFSRSISTALAPSVASSVTALLRTRGLVCEQSGSSLSRSGSTRSSSSAICIARTRSSFGPEVSRRPSRSAVSGSSLSIARPAWRRRDFSIRSNRSQYESKPDWPSVRETILRTLSGESLISGRS